ncbi:MAG: 2,3-bisphosphoglycerate-independent phosphoglycerate mutase [Xanthomonadales bacterium]|nr:2,3-bisphosphoglycerate-independent phosphoglycerate mutase [Xanthomonadales bacterium]MDH4019192.1 2,3-bisphosphoglycerate-independent phosphoglycerate mutase [Xanthomonadales bacterium]
MTEKETPKNETINPTGPLVLMILDGWGHREDAEDNAISQASTPCWDKIQQLGVGTTIQTSGEFVGLPAGQMGNSEVGHMNIGAGRIVFQNLTLISNAIEEGSFSSNPALLKAISASRNMGSTLHIMGLLSPGGVHSHEDHFFAMVKLAAAEGVPDIRVHAFLDGRDTPPRSAGPSIQKMQKCLDDLDQAAFGSLCGRYYAMDRDKRWDRVEKAWKTLVDGEGMFHCADAETALKNAYERGENDEFVSPTVISSFSGIKDGDAVIFVNFRADRAREISQAFIEPGFTGFERQAPELSSYVCMTQYLEDLPAEVAYPPEQLTGLLGQVLSEHGLSQLRTAETEKYAHVTFFFNGGEEEPFPGEQRLLVPSPDVATYDLQPEMSIEKLSSELDKAIRSGEFDVIICNVANPDMVGHTGSMKAAITAVEAVDDCLGVVLEAIQSVHGELLVTADHGNIEQMIDHQSGQSHTAHTTNPVPLVFYGRKAETLAGGALRDIAPTMLYLLELPQPPEMTGRSLLELSNRSCVKN